MSPMTDAAPSAVKPLPFRVVRQEWAGGSSVALEYDDVVEVTHVGPRLIPYSIEVSTTRNGYTAYETPPLGRMILELMERCAVAESQRDKLTAELDALTAELDALKAKKAK